MAFGSHGHVTPNYLFKTSSIMVESTWVIGFLWLKQH